MAVDREKVSIITVITKITYTLDGNDLLRRTRVKVKDKDDVQQVISDVTDNVGRKNPYKRDLKDERDELIVARDNQATDINNEIDFLDAQITDIEAL
jgi:polyhydroxyalkanoate synthesis regulator phasin